MASITEVGSPGGGVNFPVIGAATMNIFNVTPHPNGDIHIRWYVNWNLNLIFRISIMYVI
jgi:hypothetical protein